VGIFQFSYTTNYFALRSDCSSIIPEFFAHS